MMTTINSCRLLGSLAAVIAGFGFSLPANAVSSCTTPDASVTITTCFFDLTAAPSTTQSPTSAVLNGGIFRVPAIDSELGQGFIVGTGVFQPFLRIQEQGNGSADGIESGFNTDGRAGVGQAAKELDNHDKGGTNWNHSIKLSDIPTITVCDGGGSTGSNCHQYYEFLLDINEQGNDTNAGLSLDEFKLFVAGVGDITGSSAKGSCAPDSTNGGSFALCGATEVYDMDQTPGGDASLLLDYRNFSGSGNGLDLQTLIPVEKFSGVASNSYVYLYSKFGATDQKCKHGSGADYPCQTPGGPLSSAAGKLDYSADAGFEEWSIRKKIPLPATALMIGLGLVMMGLTQRRRPQMV
ncbi:MAG TPA: hypothetical protein VM532_14585 [Burkholderiales bacterium]|nr:hypothetical protein [Burkholderiales bacterium]